MKIIKIALFILVILGVTGTAMAWRFGLIWSSGTLAAEGTIESDYSKAGPHKVTATKLEEQGELSYVYYYPVDFEGKAPIILIGNGSNSTGDTYEAFMKHLASYGFVVMDTYDGTAGTGLPIVESYKVLLKESEKDSYLSSIADVDKVGLVGESQGSTGVINAHTNYEIGQVFDTLISVALPRLVLCDEEDVYDTSKVTVPMMIVTGTKDSFISPEDSCMEALDQVSSDYDRAFLNAKGTGHLELNGGGIKYLGPITAWFCYQLKEDIRAESLFFGADPEIYKNEGWERVVVRQAEVVE